MEQLDVVEKAFDSMRIDTWKHIATYDPVIRDKIANDIAKDETRIRQALNRYEKEDISDDKDRALFAGVKQAIATYYPARDKVLKLSASGELDLARQTQLGNQDIIVTTYRAIADHRAYNAQLAAEGSKRAEAVHTRSAWISVVVTVMFAAGTTFVGHSLINGLTIAIGKTVEIANKVAAGDLTRKHTASRSDEIGQLLAALNRMSDKLHTIIGAVQQEAAAIQAASHEIARSSIDLSARTEQQASVLEETTASVEELTSAVQHNAELTTQARRLADEAAQTAIVGGKW